MSVKKYLEDQNFVVMDHPPYSSDFAPCDFWLFSYIKARLRQIVKVSVPK